MRILILGGDGMLGHQLLRQLQAKHEVRVTLRRRADDYRQFGLFNTTNAFYEVDARSVTRVASVLDEFRPYAVINAVGLVKQRPDAHDHIALIEVNALFPHRLAEMCRKLSAQLIHISTDCVFSGNKTNYSESDQPDPIDIYGLTKLLGEIDGSRVLTLRTSMIGSELARRFGLVEWFLAQRGMIKGYKKMIFSGLTTIELGRILDVIVTRYSDASGLFHVSSAPISKYDLLVGLKKRLELTTEIMADEAVVTDRSLDSARFRRTFNYSPPSWDEMLDEFSASLSNRRLMMDSVAKRS